MRQLTGWLSLPDPERFPYDPVVDEFHRVGKHFVGPELLGELDGVRSVLPEIRGPATSVRMLDRFLDTALDKWDNRYDYPTYLALNLLPLPALDETLPHVPSAEWERDRLVVLLVTDALAFELAVLDGRTDLFPEMRPDARAVRKRCRLGLRAIEPGLARIGLGAHPEPDGTGGSSGPDGQVIEATRRACAAVHADLSPVERRTLRLSVLPVYVMHDEYMFMRALQAFEATFALLAVQIRSAVAALADARADTAVRRLAAAETTLRESAPLFSMVATMQVNSFRTFRAYTEGASAIQSPNYKTVEALCRQPDQPRLDSVAYTSVPEVRERVLAGQATVDDMFDAARRSGTMTLAERDRLDRAMSRFAATLSQWRQTHYRIAMRMLGDLRGTGYTEGTPYLDEVRGIPVFRMAGDRDATGEDRDG